MRLYQYYSVYGFSNSYMLGNDDSRQAIIIDPAEISPQIIGHIENNGYTLDAILLTHNHVHHTRGIKTLSRIYAGCTIYGASNEVLGLDVHVLHGNESFRAAGLVIASIAMPGHSQDSLLYHIDYLLFSGDSIHAGLIGKTTSSYNSESLARRLHDTLITLPGSTMLLPGHGPPSTIDTERRFNVGLQPGYADTLRQRYDFFV